ncbi:hypothetical protein FRC03_005424 [Tulasnella sp. 419]|nr:hypothetical protein FRC03_005424 [Tulasnella sp. 419]
MDAINIPFVKGIAAVALEVINIAKAIQTNREECADLVERSTSLLVVILGSLATKAEDAVPDDLRRGIERLTTWVTFSERYNGMHSTSLRRCFYEVLAELRIIEKRSRTWRAVLYYLDNGDKLKCCSEQLHWAMDEFEVTAKVDSCLKDLERHEELRRGQVQLQETQQELLKAQLKIDEHITESQTRIEAIINKSHTEIEECIKEGHNEVRDGLLGLRDAIKEQIAGPLPSMPSTVMPPDPKIFGRKEYVGNAIKLLLSTTGAKIVILGPGGIGKTSVALRVIHDSLVVERFGENRSWVPCEQATSVPLFVELVAKSLKLPSSTSNDRLADIIVFLKSSGLLVVLLFDNFETPWDMEGQQSNVADVITVIASIPSVSLIITMRGTQHPSSHTIDWTQPRLPLLPQLDLDSAEEAFLRISPNAVGDSELRTLLQKLDCMPLAITLMAKLSEAGETVTDLLEQWESERTRLLDQPGGDRRNSIEVSIKLSLDSRAVRGNPDAIRLLSVVAMLPAGAALAQLPDMCPSIPGWKAALRVLRGAALVNDCADNSRIRMLSPVRSYILLHHPLGPESLKELRASFYKLVPEGKTEPEHSEFTEVAKVITKEESNMEAILVNALHDQNEDREESITASISYSIYLHYHQPRTDIISEVVQVARTVASAQLAHCLYWHASILDRQGELDEAEPIYVEARSEYLKLGELGWAAECNGLLGALLGERAQYDKAIAVIQEARDALLALGDTSRAAWCLWDIGQTFYGQALKTALGRYVA